MAALSSGVRRGFGYPTLDAEAADLAQLVIDRVVERVHPRVSPEAIQREARRGRTGAGHLEQS